MDEQYVSIWELILLQLFMSSITYLVGSIVFFFTLRKVVINKSNRVILLLLQLCISVILSLVVWQFWVLDIDIMYLFISIPALIAECITIPITLFVLKRLSKTNKKTIEFIIIFILINSIMYLLFRFYQPFCEPCISQDDCPTCLSKEQYIIIGLWAVIDLIYILLFSIFQRRTTYGDKKISSMWLDD